MLGPELIFATEMRVAIIDDDVDSREVLREFLSMSSYECEAFATGADAIARHSDQPFDAVLVDLGLPENGLNVVTLLRVVGPTIAVIAYSGHGELRGAARDAGCDAFVLKPNVDDLEAELRQAELSLKARGTSRRGCRA